LPSSNHTFKGGVPELPVAIPLPACASCGSGMSFFLQVALSQPHPWGGSVVAVFQCISCCDENSLIPAMIEGELAGAVIPEGFLSDYQTNFRILVAPASECVPRRDYTAQIVRAEFEADDSRLGESPRWLLDDESPGGYGTSTTPVFLFQLPQGTKFDRLPGAPKQKTLDLSGAAVDSDEAHYELFVGNQLYVFGFGDPAGDHVYVITQVD
jgi:hypothetical protein